MLIFLIPLPKIYNIVYFNDGVRPKVNTSIGDYPSTADNLWISTHKTLLFYFIYTLPHQLFIKSNLVQAVPPPPIIEKKLRDLNVILVMGESMSSDHMSSFHYFRPTTPFLNSLKKNPKVIFKSGISAGVCTDISLSMFFNSVLRPDGTMQIASTQWNLFKMAKNNGFQTYFISAQSPYSLNIIRNYLFPKFIDHYVDSNDLFSIYFKNKGFYDEGLVEYLQEMDFSKPVFLVLHQKGSHFPYILRYPEKFDIFKTAESDFKQYQIDTYDNSLSYTDSLIASLYKLVPQKTRRPTLIIVTSDHGESLGESGIFGHNHLQRPEQFHVPMIFISLNGADLDILKQKDKEDVNSAYMSHYELSQIIASLLGYHISNFSTQRNQGYFVDGNVLNGASGFNHIVFNDDGSLINHFPFEHSPVD